MTGSLPSALPLTPGRRAALAIGVPLVLLVIGWNALTAVAWAGQDTYPVRLNLPDRGATATVQVDSGQLTVRPGRAGRLGITGIARYTLVRSRVSWQTGPSGVAVRSSCRWQVTGPCTFNYTVAVPGGTAARVTDGSGDVTAEGLTGQLTLESGSGDLALWSLSAGVKANTGSGDINGSGLTGPSVLAESGSGDVHLTGVGSPGVTVSDGSGDVNLTFTRVPGHVRITVGSGNVSVVLPKGGTAYQVNATTGSGATTVGVPRNPASAHVITITDQSGDITVTQ
jgi:hypothetical protein